MADDDTVGTISWSNVDNAKVSDGSYATAVLENADESHYINATNFGFSIPVDATINGIVVEIEKKASSSTSNYIYDNVLKLRKSTGIVGSNLGILENPWSTVEAYQLYGGSSNLWGTTFTPAEINHSGFGVSLQVWAEMSSGNNTASIDHIRITVYYTEATSSSTSLSSCSSSFSSSSCSSSFLSSSCSSSFSSSSYSSSFSSSSCSSSFSSSSSCSSSFSSSSCSSSFSSFSSSSSSVSSTFELPWSDNFSTYETGSDASPTWTDQTLWDASCDWEVQADDTLMQKWVGGDGDDCVCLTGNTNWTDVHLSVKVKCNSSTENSGANIKVRAQDAYNYYYAMILPYWDCVILKKLYNDGADDEYISEDYEITIDTDTWYTLELGSWK